MALGRRMARAVGTALLLTSVVGAAATPASATPAATPASATTTTAVAVPLVPADPGYSLTDLPAQSFSCRSGCVDARGHGATGDGSTDDAPVLQTLLDGALAARTPVLYLPAGTYLLSRTLLIPAGVTLRGAGIVPGAATVLLADWSKRSAISHVLRPESPAATVPVTIRDLTVDGGRRAGVCANGANDDQLCPADHVGGISAGNHWTITRVRFVGINGFKAWVAGVTDVQVSWCRFDDLVPGATSGGMDNIGGGAAAARVSLLDNAFDASAAGNAIDLTRASRVSVARNRVWGETGDPHSIFLEGVTDSQVTDNVLRGGSSIGLQSNGNYASAVTNGVINPRNVTVRHNLLVDPDWAGVQVLYRGLVGDGAAYALTHPLPTGWTATGGGANTIAQNTIIRPAKAGVVLAGSDDEYKTAADTVTGNVVVDPGQDADVAFNDGFGESEIAGIIVAIGRRDSVVGNTVINQYSSYVRYGVVLGRKLSPSGTVRTRATDTRVSGTVVSGLAGPAVRRSIPLVSQVSAQPVPTTGGATVTVRGSGYLRSDPLRVVVGGTRVQPTVVSDTQLTFVTPVLSEGADAVEVVSSFGSSATPVAGLDATRDTVSPAFALRAVMPVTPVLAAATVVPARTGATVRVPTDVSLGDAAGYAAHRVTALLTVATGVRKPIVRYVNAGHIDVVFPAGPTGSATLWLVRDGVTGGSASLTYGAWGTSVGLAGVPG